MAKKNIFINSNSCYGKKYIFINSNSCYGKKKYIY